MHLSLGSNYLWCIPNHWSRLMKDEEVPVKKIEVWLKTAAAERDVEELKAEG